MAKVVFHLIPEFKNFLWDPLTLIVWSKFSLNKWLCLCNNHPSFIDNRQFLTQLNTALWTPHYYRINIFLSLEKASPHIFSIFNSLHTDTPLKRTLFMVPSVSLFTGFTCISISWNIFNHVLVLQLFKATYLFFRIIKLNYIYDFSFLKWQLIIILSYIFIGCSNLETKF